MVDAISSYATSAIAAADAQIAAVTDAIANQVGASPPPSAVFGSSAVAAPPVTGTQPSSAASQVFQALQAPPPIGGSGIAPAVSRTGNDDVSYQPGSSSADAQGLVVRPSANPPPQGAEQAAAATAFAASVQSLQSADPLDKGSLNLTA